MRHIGTVENEKQAFILYSYLLEAGIHSTYEKAIDQETQKEVVSIWIYEEDETEKALSILNEFKENPHAPKFSSTQFPEVPPQPPDLLATQKEEEAQKEKENLAAPWKKRVESSPRKKRAYPLTYFVILLCVLLYIWTSAQQFQVIKEDGKLALDYAMVPIQQELMFDYPQSNQAVNALLKKIDLKDVKDLNQLPPQERAQFAAAEKIPTWRGWVTQILYAIKKKPETSIEGPLFVKISQGQIWRLFTPCLLHGGLLHILFNMAWAFILLRQIEDRLPKWKICILMIIIGIISNLAQYFMSGPYFLGFSGIICGLVGFIWVRQKKAPWEGYPLHRTTIIFILVFIGAMFALEVFSFLTTAFTKKEYSANIANTAHIVGGLIGIVLGRVPFFARGIK